MKSPRYLRSVTHALLVVLSIVSFSTTSLSQTRKDFLQPGEELVYKVKYGFVKLGTVVMQTGNVSSDGLVSTHLHFWTADIPFLNAKTTDNEQYYADDLCVRSFEEHSINGDDKLDVFSTYDRATKTLQYADDKRKNVIKQNVEPYDDALGVLFNMRAWSGAAGHKYIFLIHEVTDVKPITVDFSNEISEEEVPALNDKKVRTRVLHGTMDLGGSAPLGADGSFTAYVSDDNAAVPVRIEMKIAIGSITLSLDKIKRTGWVAEK